MLFEIESKKIVSNEKQQEVSVYERLWKLEAKVNMMVMDGVRDAEKFADLLQTIIDEKVYLKRLFAGEIITFGDVKVVIYELVKDATFERMFGDIGEKRRCWKDKEEALRFSHEHKEKLGPNGNFFELEGGLVARVDVGGDGQPCVDDVYGLSDDDVWDAEYGRRVFCPQQ